MRGRRPLLRAVMVGGEAYHTGKRAQQERECEAEQNPPVEDSESQRAAPRSGEASGLSSKAIEQLTQLGELKAEGVLTDAEFEAQKQRLLRAT